MKQDQNDEELGELGAELRQVYQRMKKVWEMMEVGEADTEHGSVRRDRDEAQRRWVTRAPTRAVHQDWIRIQRYSIRHEESAVLDSQTLREFAFGVHYNRDKNVVENPLRPDENALESLESFQKFANGKFLPFPPSTFLYIRKQKCPCWWPVAFFVVSTDWIRANALLLTPGLGLLSLILSLIPGAFEIVDATSVLALNRAAFGIGITAGVFGLLAACPDFMSVRHLTSDKALRRTKLCKCVMLRSVILRYVFGCWACLFECCCGRDMEMEDTYRVDDVADSVRININKLRKWMEESSDADRYGGKRKPEIANVLRIVETLFLMAFYMCDLFSGYQGEVSHGVYKYWAKGRYILVEDGNIFLIDVDEQPHSHVFLEMIIHDMIRIFQPQFRDIASPYVRPNLWWNQFRIFDSLVVIALDYTSQHSTFN